MKSVYYIVQWCPSYNDNVDNVGDGDWLHCMEFGVWLDLAPAQTKLAELVKKYEGTDEKFKIKSVKLNE